MNAEPFAARITETGIETNRMGALTNADVAELDRLRMVARIIAKRGVSPIGLRLRPLMDGVPALIEKVGA